MTDRETSNRLQAELAEKKRMFDSYFTSKIQDAAGESTITRHPITGPDWPVRSDYQNRQQFRAACAAWRTSRGAQA